ncbi:MAG: hypothetical protein Q7J32_03805 [Sphingomonadaceae bacterium]|nr:hypothetical protein [Sphingomonadaceae bacterium]
MASRLLSPDGRAENPHAFAGEMVEAAAAATRQHPHAATVASAPGDHPVRIEAVHFFTLLHAERPSAAGAAAAADPHRWVTRFAAAFEADRSWLARAAVAGAAPRRADLTRHELLVRQQREAMLTLARSDRAGCALGAVAALAVDWPAVRATLSGEAGREIDPMIADTIEAAAMSPAARRAIGFGVAQMIAIHRTLWDLLEARQAASLP